MIAYNCKYTPIELLRCFDDCILLNNSADNFDYAESRMHPNMCSHIKALFEEIHANPDQRLFLMNCCTCTMRLADVVSSEGDSLIKLLDLPTETDGCAVRRLQNDLLALIPKLEALYGKPFDPELFVTRFDAEPVSFPQMPYILLLGARSNPALLKTVSSCFRQPVIDMTCTNNGRIVNPDISVSDSLPVMMEKYARALLNQIPCMRMSDTFSRRQLLENEHCIGIVYHTIKFCDYYHFEYHAIEQGPVPVLKIETDYTSQSGGQILTRLEGFAESLAQRAEESGAQSYAAETENNMKPYVAGIDSGSTSTELVAIDKDRKIIQSVMVRTGANASAGAQKALEASGIDPEEIGSIVATGYGRKNISFARGDVTEITCHAKGAKHLYPDVRTIIDIGGQDSKVISLDESGNVTHFAMNDKCAAGTGRFLENMAKVLEIDLSQMAELGLSYKNDLTISSMCTVFAESEVVSLIAENHALSDIIHGLNKSVAVKTKALAGKASEKGGLMMTGGVANNKGVAAELEKQLHAPVFIPDSPEYCGALGAALIAAERYFK